MTPLEAAKELAELLWETVEAEDYTGTTWKRCKVCYVAEYDHNPDCPSSHVSAIIAALEAADRLVELPPVETLVTDACVFCYAEGCKGLEFDEPEWTIDHAPDCRWRALTTALKGEQS